MKTAHDLSTVAKARVDVVSKPHAESAIRDADVLIDVREADQFAAGHLDGAMHIPRGLWEFVFSSTPALESHDHNIVLYYKTSGRTALSALALQEMG